MLVLSVVVTLGLGPLGGLAAATVPAPSADRLIVGGTEALVDDEARLGRSLDAVRIYHTWSPTSLPVLDMTKLRRLADGGERSIFISAVIPWASWKSEADRLNSDGTPGNNVPVPYCKWRPTDPATGSPLAKSWFAAFADGQYDARLRTWLSQLNSLGDPDTPVYVSLMPEADRLDAGADTAAYRACVGSHAEYRAGWQRAYQVAGGAAGGTSLNLDDGQGGHLVWVPVFTGHAFTHTSGASAPQRRIINFATGRPSTSDSTLGSARATPWMPPSGTWDHVGIDVFNFSGALAGKAVPSRIKVDDPATTVRESDQWRSLEVLLRPVLLWSQHNAPRPDGKPATVFLAEVGSVPDPTRPTRRPDWIRSSCTYLSTAPRVVGALYFDANTNRLSTWKWTKKAGGSWDATAPPTGLDPSSIARWGELMGSSRAGGTGTCG